MDDGKARDQVNAVKRKQSHKRGYPVALLVGFEYDHAVLWQVFSHVAKLCLTLQLTEKRTDRRALYNFHESIVDALRPLTDEGIRSIVVTSPARTTYATDFLNHVRKHHSYLIRPERPDGISFTELVGSADKPYDMVQLVKTKEFSKLVTETISQETDQVLNAMQKRLQDSGSVVLFSLNEIEDAICHKKRPGDSRMRYLMLTDKYLADYENKNRLHRLLQISQNRGIKSRIVNAEAPAGKRISQFGGIIFLTLPAT